MYLTDLADAARKSGLRVVEVDGWRTRGHGPMSLVRTIAVHHTATSAQADGDYPSLRVVRDGTERLDGPLAHLGLGRDGTVYVIAAGLCYHAGVVQHREYSNAFALGIEAEHPGVGVWPAKQYDAYARLCAALCEHYELPVGRVLGHKEICDPPGRKVDPNFDMKAFRDEVAQVMEESEMAYTDSDREAFNAFVKQMKARADRTLAFQKYVRQALGADAKVDKDILAKLDQLLDEG